MTRFILVRHGQTEWNRVERFRGRADIPLNDTGRAQARRVGARLARENIAAIYSSPLSRALETARAIAEPHGLAVVADAGLVDIDYGAWEGKTPDEMRDADSDAYRIWLRQPTYARFPNGERLRDVRVRAPSAVEQIARKHVDETVVLVSHRIVCKVLLCAVLGLHNNAIWRIDQSNAAISVFEKRGDAFFVERVNDAAHLDYPDPKGF